MEPSHIRMVKPEDAPAIREIYNYYILHSIITFEETPVSLATMRQRLEIRNDQLPWLVYEKEQEILGYAYASPWKARSAYRFAAESTIYLKNGVSGRGIGTLLYEELIRRLTELDFHVVIGGISLPNAASVALHEKLGFQKVAHFKEVGFKFNRWIDVGYWELMILNKKS